MVMIFDHRRHTHTPSSYVPSSYDLTISHLHQLFIAILFTLLCRSVDNSPRQVGTSSTRKDSIEGNAYVMGGGGSSKNTTPMSTPGGTQKEGRKKFFPDNGIHTSVSDGGLYQTSLFPTSLSHNHLASLSSSSSSLMLNNGGGFQSRASSDALQMLAERGQENSSLVSLGLPKELNSHWLVTTSKRNMSFVGHIARSITVSDSVLTGIIRAFTALGVLFTLILCTLSVASYTQQNLQLFPRLFDFVMKSDGSVHFDHKIANVTLYPPKLPSSWSSSWPSSSSSSSSSSSFVSSDYMTAYPDNRVSPHYASCR